MTRPSSASDRRRGARAPSDLVNEFEADPKLPAGFEERFAGYGVMGLPFRSGHLLAMRRFAASSVGPGYQSVWHRDPLGRWTFFQDVPHADGCARYFSSAIDEILTARIAITWDDPHIFTVAVAADRRRLQWNVTLGESVITRAMNAASSLVPVVVWRNRRFLAALGATAGPVFGAGKLRLEGRAPNGQRFAANPQRVWLVAASKATLDGVDLGEPGAAPTPGRMEDCWIPQRGMFVLGRAFFSDGRSAPSMRPPLTMKGAGRWSL